MKRARVLTVAVSLTALVASGVLVGTSALAAPTPRFTLAEGTVAGSGVADIQLYQWPSDSVLRTMHVGQAAHWKLVYRGLSNAEGYFDVTSTAKLAGTLELVAVSSRGISTYGFTASSHPTRVDPVLVKGDSAFGIESQTLAEEGPDVVSCSPATDVHNYAPAWDVVGQEYNDNAAYVGITFTYAKGASSSLGLGVSGSDAYGSFSADGTDSVSSTNVQPFPEMWRDSYNYLLTEFSSQLWETSCYNSISGQETHLYQTRNVGWDGGDKLQDAGSAPSTPYCVPELAGSDPTISSTTAVTWSDGFTLGSVLGLNLSTQTGYSTTASFNFDFIDGGELCGTEDYPFRTNPGPSQMVVRS